MTAKLRRSGPASYSLAKEAAIRSQPRSAPTIMVYLPGMYRPVLQRSYPREPKIDSTKLALSRGVGWFISGGFSPETNPRVCHPVVSQPAGIVSHSCFFRRGCGPGSLDLASLTRHASTYSAPPQSLTQPLSDLSTVVGPCPPAGQGAQRWLKTGSPIALAGA